MVKNRSTNKKDIKTDGTAGGIEGGTIGGTTERKAGILMPISSLPSPHGIGTLGADAFRFVAWLASSGMKIWQILPLLPTGYGNSPYQSCASNALNYYLIDFELLRKDGLLKKSEYANTERGDPRRVDYGKLFNEKAAVLEKAFERFDQTDREWQNFLKEGAYADFSLFMALKSEHGYLPWTKWGEYRRYSEEKATAYIEKHRKKFEFWQFTQFIFLRQWRTLKAYANRNGVEIVGDMPLYVAFDSVETWKHGKELFQTDKNGLPTLRAGVPPDAFSADGQLWGNPVYSWRKMKKNGYQWWRERIGYALTLFDYVRIDHFRAFDRYYAIEKNAKTAREGTWRKGAGYPLFEGVKGARIIAEDLGMIDDGVKTLLKKTGYPGMKVLEFALDGDKTNPHKPSNYQTDHCVAYTGTHDNAPLVAYMAGLNERAYRTFSEELRAECKKAGVPYRGSTKRAQAKSAVRLVLASRAFMAVIPMQDVLCLGKEARINEPSTLSPQNWSYRFKKGDFSDSIGAWLKSLAEKYGR